MDDTTTHQVRLEIDQDAQAAYIKLRDGAVVHTESVAQDVVVDLDEYGIVLGVEVLSLTADIPFGVLSQRFHVHSEDIDALRRVQPSVAGFLSITTGTDSTIRASERKPLAA